MVVVKSGSGWVVKSSTGKLLSKVYESRRKALKRLRQIEFFKNKGH